MPEQLPTPGCLWCAKRNNEKQLVRIVRNGKTKPTIGGDPQPTVTFVRLSGGGKGKEVRAMLAQFTMAFQPVRPT